MRVVIAALLALAAIASAQVDPSKTIVQNAQQVPALSTLVTVLTSPGYSSILQALDSPGTYTVFAPTNDAFAAAGVNPADVPFVTDVLLYHVLPAVVFSNQLAPLNFPSSLLTNSSVVFRNGAGQNVEVAKLADGSVEIYFGVPGVPSTTAKVVLADVRCSNGVVHVIDKVLLYPNTTANVAIEDGLSTLVSAVVKAGLVSVIDNTNSITVFAPTNHAFKAAGIDISKLSPQQLATVLEYHVVPAVAFSTQLTDGEALPTVQGGQLKVGVSSQGVTVNNIPVIAPNVLLANGVAHVIDGVLLPTTVLLHLLN